MPPCAGPNRSLGRWRPLRLTGANFEAPGVPCGASGRCFRPKFAPDCPESPRRGEFIFDEKAGKYSRFRSNSPRTSSFRTPGRISRCAARPAHRRSSALPAGTSESEQCSRREEEICPASPRIAPNSSHPPGSCQLSQLSVSGSLGRRPARSSRPPPAQGTACGSCAGDEVLRLAASARRMLRAPLTRVPWRAVPRLRTIGNSLEREGRSASLSRHRMFAASSASGLRSPFISETWPASFSFLNLFTTCVRPLFVAST